MKKSHSSLEVMGTLKGEYTNKKAKDVVLPI